jgi:CheY-like chemotaxis protein
MTRMAKTILIVDDERDIRDVAQMSLELVGGWSVITAGSGAEAIEIAARERPDAILLDVMMPEMDGPTTFRRLRASPPTAEIPVILLTAKVQANDRRGFDDLGVEGVIPKPFDPVTLSARVSEILDEAPA